MSPGLLLFGAFLLGSIPFGLFVARAFNVKDIRSQGSGNIGATNVSRIAGFWPAGALTLLLDVLKGFVPVFALQQPAVQQWWAGLRGLAMGDPSDITVVVVWAVALAAVLGHCFSPWLRFKGGKGVATGLGVIAALTPVSAVCGAVCFLACFLTTRTGSLSSLVGIAGVAISYLILAPLGVQSWLGLAIVSVLVFRHEANLDALLESRERVF